MGQASEGDQNLNTQSNTHNNVVYDIADITCDDIIKLSAVNPANTYHVVGETPSWGSVKFVIDTGAAVSLKCEDMWTRITGGSVGLSLWMGSPLVGAEGSKISIKGVATMVFSIAGQKVEGDFLVTNQLSSEAILGLDFLEQNQCVINAEQHTVHLQGKAAMGNRKTGLQLAQLSLAASDKLVVPPLSKLEIMASVQCEGKSNDNLSHTYLVEAIINNRYPIVVVTAIVLPIIAGKTPLIPVRLTNLSSESVTFYKHSNIHKTTLN